MRKTIIFIATGAWIGYLPYAPGTFGSIAGLMAGLALAPLWRSSPLGFLGLFAALFLASCWIAGRAEAALDEHDSPRIVLDEVFGMVATMYLNPTTWIGLVAAFALFRIFDIIKPFPASLFDRRLPGGAGVMLDDIAAGAYANLALQAAHRLL